MTETIRGERRLLKRVLRLSGKSLDKEVSFNQLNISSDNFYMLQLFEHGLVRSNHSATSFKPFDGDDGVLLTVAGLHFFEITNEQLVNKFLFDFVRPVSVSIATTIIMWLLGYLFGLIRIHIS